MKVSLSYDKLSKIYSQIIGYKVFENIIYLALIFCKTNILRERDREKGNIAYKFWPII